MDDSRTISSEFVPGAYLANRHDPFKDPARRWRRCEYLIAHGRRPFSGRDDPATWAAWRFRWVLGRHGAEAGRERLSRWFPELHEAYRFFTEVEPLKRWELEARLLAGEADDVIAGKCGMTSAGVQAYHDTFYAVRPYLHASAYIASVVLAGKACMSVPPDDHETLLKSLGYKLGGQMVDRVLDCLRDPPHILISLEGSDLSALEKLRVRLRTKILMLLETTPASAAPLATWLRIEQRFVDATRVAQGDLLAPIRAMLDVVACLSRGTAASTAEGNAARQTVPA
jgi:hypothetical protein